MWVTVFGFICLVAFVALICVILWNYFTHDDKGRPLF